MQGGPRRVQGRVYSLGFRVFGSGFRVEAAYFNYMFISRGCSKPSTQTLNSKTTHGRGCRGPNGILGFGCLGIGFGFKVMRAMGGFWRSSSNKP